MGKILPDSFCSSPSVKRFKYPFTKWNMKYSMKETCHRFLSWAPSNVFCKLITTDFDGLKVLFASSEGKIALCKDVQILCIQNAICFSNHKRII